MQINIATEVHPWICQFAAGVWGSAVRRRLSDEAGRSSCLGISLFVRGEWGLIAVGILSLAGANSQKPLFFTLVNLGRKFRVFLLYPCLGTTRLYWSRIPKRKFSVSDHWVGVSLLFFLHYHLFSPSRFLKVSEEALKKSIICIY